MPWRLITSPRQHTSWMCCLNESCRKFVICFGGLHQFHLQVDQTHIRLYLSQQLSPSHPNLSIFRTQLLTAEDSTKFQGPGA